jgi:peptide deformylase
MARKEVITFPHQVLRQNCEAVANINGDIIQLIDDMAETMYAYRGVGLAAPQIGVTKRIIVLDVGQGLISLLNPEIVDSEGTAVREEGCLCLPEITVNVERKEKIYLKGIDKKGTEVAFEADGLLARALQHEIDHLQGTLIIDKLSKLKRDMIIRRLRKQQLKAQK